MEKNTTPKLKKRKLKRISGISQKCRHRFKNPGGRRNGGGLTDERLSPTTSANGGFRTGHTYHARKTKEDHMVVHESRNSVVVGVKARGEGECWGKTFDAY